MKEKMREKVKRERERERERAHERDRERKREIQREKGFNKKCDLKVKSSNCRIRWENQKDITEEAQNVVKL